LAEISHTHDASDTSSAHQLCILVSKANGRIIVPTRNTNCFYTIFFYFTQNWKIKIFLLWYLRTIICGFIFFR